MVRSKKQREYDRKVYGQNTVTYSFPPFSLTAKVKEMQIRRSPFRRRPPASDAPKCPFCAYVECQPEAKAVRPHVVCGSDGKPINGAGICQPSKEVQPKARSRNK